MEYQREGTTSKRKVYLSGKKTRGKKVKKRRESGSKDEQRKGGI